MKSIILKRFYLCNMNYLMFNQDPKKLLPSSYLVTLTIIYYIALHYGINMRNKKLLQYSIKLKKPRLVLCFHDKM